MQFYLGIWILLTIVVIQVSCQCGTVRRVGNQPGVFPWHVLIYRSDSTDSRTQICAGTLISSSVVISAALCFYDEELRTTHDANSFIVAAGKRFRPYDWQEDDVQESVVETIHIPNSYSGYIGNFANNIAWLILQKPFDLTKLTIAPVCIDLENQYESDELQNGQIGKAVGQSYNAAGYPSDELQETNVPFVPYAECVASLPSDSDVTVTSDKICAGSLNESKLCSRDIGGGLVFSHNDRWYLRGVVSISFALGKDCGHGYFRSFTNTGRFIEETKTKIDTQVTVNPPKKNLICGISTIPNPDTLIANGEDANLGGFPWHVGIYRKNGTGYFEQICGGSLVSENVVVTAAHCFYDDKVKRKMDANRFAVAGGKRYRPYNWLERFVQKSPIEAIHLSSRYHGIDGLYAGDIAWVILEQHFQITAFLRPVCLESSIRQKTEQSLLGQIGKVAGWGVTQDGTESHTLQQIRVPFIPYQECISQLPEDHKPYVTVDKFCAGYLNGIMLCEGDSGGGLVFQRGGHWYLRGIVSVNPRGGMKCDRKFYTAFTDVTLFNDELRKFTDITP